MYKKLIPVVGVAALLAFADSASAQCGPSAGGAVAGATAGAVTGAVVGGPVGAAVGGVVGGAAGAAAVPRTACTYVIEQNVPAVTVEKEVVVGQPLPDAVVLHEIPEYKTYVFANVNNHRVLVDPKTRVVVEVVK